MSRASVFHAEYGVIGAGALGKSLIGQLPRKLRQIGPVVGASFRVASRMANSLRAGHAARTADELNEMPVILFHTPADQIFAIAQLLETAHIDWKGKALVFCDCKPSIALRDGFHLQGAETAVVRQFGIADRIMVEGTASALACAHRMAGELRLKAIEIAPGSGDMFSAAVTLATSALTPLIHHASNLLRASGLRDREAARMATVLFEQTVQAYGHSGKQSWAWHIREPESLQVEAEIAAVAQPFREVFRQLILSGLDDFEKHPEVARALRSTEHQITSD
jgi:hypothetical protein